MPDYIAYHRPETMGYSALDIAYLAVYTKKSIHGITGARVWVVAGEGKPRRYHLRATFLVNGVVPSDRADFTYLVRGNDGRLFDPMPRLNGEDWFPHLKRKQGNFRFGFNLIRDEAAIAGLMSILEANPPRQLGFGCPPRSNF